MKELKGESVLQELTKEEAVNTFGGSNNVVIKWVVRNGKLIFVIAEK